MHQRRNQREIRKHFELNEKYDSLKFVRSSTAVHSNKCTALKPLYQQRSPINDLSFHLEKLEKKRLKISRRKEITKTRNQ